MQTTAASNDAVRRRPQPDRRGRRQQLQQLQTRRPSRPTNHPSKLSPATSLGHGLRSNLATIEASKVFGLLLCSLGFCIDHAFRYFWQQKNLNGKKKKSSRREKKPQQKEQETSAQLASLLPPPFSPPRKQSPLPPRCLFHPRQSTPRLQEFTCFPRLSSAASRKHLKAAPCFPPLRFEGYYRLHPLSQWLMWAALVNVALVSLSFRLGVTAVPRCLRLCPAASNLAVEEEKCCGRRKCHSLIALPTISTSAESNQLS